MQIVKKHSINFKKSNILNLVLFSIILLFPIPVLAKKQNFYTEPFSNLAIQGYDVVSYFKSSKAVKGKTDIKTVYKGVVWQFSSEENLTSFIAQPETYIPQYGGYCAWAVAAKGKLLKGNAHYWKIIDQKLYLNYNKKIQSRWEENMQSIITKADQVWSEIIKH